MPLKWPRKTLKQILQKSTKNNVMSWNCPASLAISEALTINPTNFLGTPFNSQFFLSFYFDFSHKTPGGLKHEKIRPKVFVCVFLIENSSLNCLKVDRIQDIEDKNKIIFFLFLNKKGYLSPLWRVRRKPFLQLSPQALGGDGRRRKSPLDGPAYL